MDYKVHRILKLIKGLKPTEIVDLAKALKTELDKPPERSRVGAYPKRPRPSLRSGAEALPEKETTELISAIASRKESK